MTATTLLADKITHQTGRLVDDATSESGKALAAAPGQDKSGYLIDQPNVSLPPGRYRVSIRLKVGDRKTHQRVITLRVGATGDQWYAFDDRIVSTADFRQEGEYQSFDFDIARPAQDGGRWNLYVMGQWEGKVPVSVGSITVTPLSQPPVLVWKVWPQKLLARPNGDQVFTVKVGEGQGQTQNGYRLRVEVVHDLDTAVPVTEQALALAPWERKDLTIHWNIGKPQYGYEVRATVVDASGKPIDSAREWFGVGDNSFRMRLGGATNFSYLDPSQAALDWGISEFRKNYGTVHEMYAWNPGMFCNLYPRKEYWASGQVSEWRYNRTILKNIIRALHENGIRVISYDACWFNGSPGMETAREHPEWLQYTREGRPVGGIDTSVWDIPGEDDKLVPLVPFSGESRNIASASPVEDPLMKRSAEEILLIARELGFDGVRWDGHPIIWANPDEKAIPGTSLGTGIWRYDGKAVRDLVKDYDAYSLHNMQLIKSQVAKQFPSFDWGYNWGYDITINGLPRTWKECVQNGGIWVEGGFRTGDLAPTDPKNTWERYVQSCYLSSQLVIRSGGYPIHGALTYTTPPIMRHQYILSVANGGHPAINDGDSVLRDYYRFVLRYSEYLYDPGIEPWWGKPKIRVSGWCTYEDETASRVPPVSQEATVSGSRPILWERLLFHRKSSPTTMDTILHLVNSPNKSHMDFTDMTAPPPQESIRVSVRAPAGMKLMKAWCLSPDRTPMGEALTSQPKNPGWVEVTIPRLDYWDIIVFTWRKG